MNEMDSRPFAAKYPGQCAADCGEPIQVGEQIMYVSNVVVHEACATSAPAGQRTATKFQGTSLEEMGF